MGDVKIWQMRSHVPVVTDSLSAKISSSADKMCDTIVLSFSNWQSNTEML